MDERKKKAGLKARDTILRREFIAPVSVHVPAPAVQVFTNPREDPY